MTLPKVYQQMRAHIIVAIGLASTMTQLSAETTLWEQLPSLPVPSGNFITGTTNGNIVIAGGITWKDDTKIWLDQIWQFDIGKTIWKETGKLPSANAYAAFGQTARGIYFCGGSDGKSTRSEFYLLKSNQEVEKIGTVSEPRVYSGVAIAGSKMFVVAGGTDVADLKTLTNSFFSVDLLNGQTQMLPEFPGEKLLVPTVASMNGKMFVFTGGYMDGEGKVLNSDAAYAYDIDDRTWKEIRSFPIPIRGLASCVLDDRYILLAGGYTNQFTDAAYVYDTQKDIYLKTEPLPFAAMSTFVKHEDNIYWLGGEDRMKHRSELFYVARWKRLIEAAKNDVQ